jgi:thioredoxin-dependent peroxiredoxin
VTVIGISPDKPQKLAKFRELDGLNFTLVSDPDRAVLTEYGVFGEKKMYGKTVTGVIRSTFVIGPDGVIQHAMYNVRAKGHVARVRELLGL